MRSKILAAAMVAVLVAAAIFLPELLLTWGDSQSLDVLRLESQDEERGGLAESIQLSVPEKILLLRGGGLTLMELDRAALPGRTAGDGAAGQYVPPGLKAATEEELERYTEETAQLWEARLASLQTEVRSLQNIGGLPEVWRADSTPEYTDFGNLLYLDPDTHMSFQVYQITLRWEGRSLALLVDVQSERILSFQLQWSQEGALNWGLQGASGFGSAWRDYWKMDSVSTSWYNEYTRGVLENVETQVATNGDYAAHDQISFLYDGQSLSIPLNCQGSRAGNFSLTWNR